MIRIGIVDFDEVTTLNYLFLINVENLDPTSNTF